MTPDEYVLRYRMYRADPKSMWEEDQEVLDSFTPDMQICFELVQEAITHIQTNAIKDPHTLASVLRDQEFKWQDIRNRLKDPKIKQVLFLDILKKVNSLLHEAYIEYRELRRVA